MIIWQEWYKLEYQTYDDYLSRKARKKQDRQASRRKAGCLYCTELKALPQEAMPSNLVLTTLFYNSVVYLSPWCAWSFWQLSLPTATGIVSLTLCACMYKCLHVRTYVLVFVYHSFCLHSFFLCLRTLPVLCPAMLCVLVIRYATCPCYTSKEHWIGTEICQLGGYGFRGTHTAVGTIDASRWKWGTMRKDSAWIVLKWLPLSWRYAAPLRQSSCFTCATTKRSWRLWKNG